MRQFLLAISLGLAVALSGGCASYNAPFTDAAYTADIASQDRIWRELALPVLRGDRVPDLIWHTEPHVRVTPLKIQKAVEDGRWILAGYLDRCSPNERLRTYLHIERVSLQREDLVILGHLHRWLLDQQGCLEEVHRQTAEK